ncbi:MAG: dihydroorotase [Synergistaceae bacterium]|jgi:dihydroorotase|nr:dihydroorotase [Synergistaceae bacterium]
MKRADTNVFVIRGGNVLTASGAEVRDISVRDGAITAIGRGLALDGARVIDASGMWVIPGLVDIHCHLREPGGEEKEDIASGTAAAAKGGFTSVCCMANTNPVNDSAVVTEFIKKRAAEAGPVHVYPIAALTKGLGGEELTEAGELADAGAIALSDDGKSVGNARMMRLALRYAKRFGLKVISHPEDTDLVDGGVMNEGYWSAAIGLPGATRAAEETIIARDCMLAAVENTSIHIAHVSTAGGAHIIRNAKRLGAAVTCETAPHYLYATDEWVRDYDTNTKVNPPLRTEDDRLALIDALLDGTIDCIATDHAPHHADDKNVEYAIAASGISGFETAFSICWTALVKSGRMTPEALFEKMTSAPARILGLDAGALAEGGAADITIIDPGAEWTVDSSKFASRGHNTPFSGHTLSGLVKCAIAGGEIAYGREWTCG